MNVRSASRLAQRERSSLGDYTLVICEKPDAARRVAEALSSSVPEVFDVEGVSAFRLDDAAGRRFVVCSAVGHLYGVSDPVKNRRVYPVADLEWFPLGAISKKGAGGVASRIRAIKSLSRGASAFVNACDLDIEGETIGHNILRYACGGKEASALRARFSSLTKEDVSKAFDQLGRADGLATAGRLRHTIDFVWGVNLSRALSESLRREHGFRTMSMGRVQGPTLNFVVEREADVMAFVPTPYWTVAGGFSKDGATFEGRYSVHAVKTRHAAEEIKASCEGREGAIGATSRRVTRRPPPPPFDLSELQQEAFKVLGYLPGRTLRVAERLYLGAMVSYPRTGSQKLPRLDYRNLLSKIGKVPGYSESVAKVLSMAVLRPREGERTDPAHPAIYPTGEFPKRPLGKDERALFDLIVIRFLSCFGDDATYEETSSEVTVGEHVFSVSAKRQLLPGWTSIASGGRRQEMPETVPAMREGEHVHVDSIEVKERFREPAMRYNQATLLEKMEREGIGTKATRADTITTLLDRGYLIGGALAPTELGFSLIEVMREHCPQIISTRLTREIESHLERIEVSGDPGSEFFERTLSTLLTQIGEMRAREKEIADRMHGSVFTGPSKQLVLGRCPVCKEGSLWVVRSRKSGKRFVGCTNYSKGCRASAPLPQRGAIRAASKPCGTCGWPVVYVRLGRHPWRLCVNDKCPRKVNVYAMRNLHKSTER